MRRKECIAVLKESPIPTRWMRAYISIYLIALIVQLALTELVFILSLLDGRYHQTFVTFIPIIILQAIGVVLLIYTAVTCKVMTDLRPSGFGWGVAHLILSAVYWTGSATLTLVPQYDSAGFGYAPYAVIFFVIYTVGWIVPNYLYFRKRRALFRVYAPREITSAMGQWHSL